MLDDLIINDAITATTVRIIEDEIAGVISKREALRIARQRNLDLVVVAAGDPPVCRILNVDHFRYERKKADREQSRKQRQLAIETKEIQLRPVTDANDIMIKAKKARGFLSEGDKVKVVVRFKGRERAHKQHGRDIMEKFLAAVGEYRVERPLTDDGDMTILLAPMVSKSDLLREKVEPQDQEILLKVAS